MVTAALLAAACADSERVVGPGLDPALDVAPTNASVGAAVYTSTNAVGGNEVVAYRREADGSLTPGPVYATGGAGTGGGLGNQGAVAFGRGANFLLVVNAGSNELTAFFRKTNGSLAFADRVSSGGEMPISVTSAGDYVYVLNAGGDGNITGFHLSTGGTLTPLAGSTRPLSQAGGTGPAQIGFTHRGRVLVVTEKATNRITTYTVGGNGLASAPIVHASAGMTPFGFAFDRRNRLVVSEAHGGAPGASTVSSYQVHLGGSLTTLSPSIPDFQSAACWIVITDNDRFTYTTNTGSNNLSGYLIRKNGTLELLIGHGFPAPSDVAPIDAALSRGGVQFLYALNAGAGTITVFRVNADGTLTPLPGGATGLPAGSNGLAAR